MMLPDSELSISARLASTTLIASDTGFDLNVVGYLTRNITIDM
jgi:hypothetical protein